jgi:hypothetical protein
MQFGGGGDIKKEKMKNVTEKEIGKVLGHWK